MIAAGIFGPPLMMGRGKTPVQRADVARMGMLGVLTQWAQDSPVTLANRKADGLGPIDQAVAAIRMNWVARNGAGALNDGDVGALLTACQNWLSGRKLFGLRITGWRESAVSDLYWSAAWAYSCDNFAQQAVLRITNNTATGDPTGTPDPVPFASLVGNPYEFPGSGYVQTAYAGGPAALLYRGDARRPDAIAADGGFMPMDLNNRWQYAPWFAGNSTSGTISTTTDVALTINAVGAAHARREDRQVGQGGALVATGTHPAWMDAALGLVGSNANAIRGYIYEFGNIPVGATHTRMTAQGAGVEEVWLALPTACISRCWAVMTGNRTFGPFTMTEALGAATPGGLNLSAPGVLA
jgi:hypothetical protein